MCTVSFYKDANKTVLTSNRDEHYSRPSALPPQLYASENYQLLYCKDIKANGTWMALRDDGTVIVLLNGAVVRHTPKYPYKKSRGLVLLDIINEENCLQKFNNYDFTDIEPFTLVIYQHTTLHECIWTGDEKLINKKPTSEEHIWSSVTLYDETFRKKKENLFFQLVSSKDELSKDDILQFHHSTQDLENGFIINRNEQLLTFSVTQIVLQETVNTFYHHDIRNEKLFTFELNAIKKESIL